jgi:phosphoribosylformylglycinamidine synthase
LRLGPLEEARNRYLFAGIVKGVGDYGIASGFPPWGRGSVRARLFRQSPVNAMCAVAREKDLMRARASGVGNILLAMGSRTDATAFTAPASLRGASEKSEARRPQVQVGDPFTEKLLLEATSS